MPILSDDVLLTLAGYTPTRDGYDIAATNTGTIYEYACWNWTLSGGVLAVNDPKSAPSIVDDLIVFDWQNNQGIYARGVNGAPAGNYPGSDPDLTIMRDGLGAAQTVRGGPNVPFTPAQSTFASALVRVMLRTNGITPSAVDDGPYIVVMKSSDWWNTDHWAIGVNVPPNNRRIYIQTVPNVPVAHNCNVVWDEDLPDVTVGVTGLLQAHVDVLNQVPKAPCRTCGDIHGWTPSVINKWHQCTRCGAIYCPQHGAALAGKTSTLDETRSCGVEGCGGRTRLW
ncbi:hypothetical protein ACJJIF_04920 [Microbulbifer sp. SSSA002]|uniref:hypothetical protein n=1 Tax=unclassified Microbulbifer TaxID=2619833 RepID=UPI00403A001A